MARVAATNAAFADMSLNVVRLTQPMPNIAIAPVTVNGHHSPVHPAAEAAIRPAGVKMNNCMLRNPVSTSSGRRGYYDDNCSGHDRAG